MIAFEVALAAGARLGDAAWGGAHAQLSAAQRFGSAVSVLSYAAAMIIVRGRAAGRAERRGQAPTEEDGRDRSRFQAGHPSREGG